MGNDKSILEKITDTVKDVATLAADAASHALKTEPSRKTDEQVVTYMPLAADGLVSDPMMVPPIAMSWMCRSRRLRERFESACDIEDPRVSNRR